MRRKEEVTEVAIKGEQNVSMTRNALMVLLPAGKQVPVAGRWEGNYDSR
jgi:hypothetical protein